MVGKRRCVASIDQGTQSTRVFLYDETGGVVASHNREFPQHRPRAGWTEHDPMEIWDSVTTCVEGAMAAAGDVEIAAVGITNQRETTLVWDCRTGKPLHNAIVWLDTRTAALCDRLTEQLGSQDYFRPVTGLPISTYFSAYKFLWLMENVPVVAEAVSSGTAMFGTIDSWLIYQLTGGVDGGIHVTDISNAARTNWMEIRTGRWHADTMALFGATDAMLPDIRSNAEVYGHVKSGPFAGVPIAGSLGDQMSAMLGQRCKVNEAKNTYGTGAFILLNTGSEPVPSEHGLLTTIAYKLGPDAQTQYALEGAIAIAGAGVSWLRDGLGVLESAEQSEELAASVDDAAGVFFVPAFSGLLAPRWRCDARGVIVGLTSYVTKAHIVRAMLEAICFQTREVVDAMRQDADLSHLKVLRVDGGASANSLMMQIQADLLQVPVLRPDYMETTAIGAAFAAGIATGFWTEEWVLHGTDTEDNATTFQPSIAGAEADRRLAKWDRAVQLSYGLADATPKLANDAIAPIIF